MSTEGRSDRELTIDEAADILNVSAGYVHGLLDKRELSFRQNGEQRYIDRDELLEYKRVDHERRERALQELVELSEELGLYDLPPAH